MEGYIEQTDLEKNAVSFLEDVVYVAHCSAGGNLSNDAHMRSPTLLQHAPDLPAIISRPQIQQ